MLILYPSRKSRISLLQNFAGLQSDQLDGTEENQHIRFGLAKEQKDTNRPEEIFPHTTIKE
jgi:hypothetical protein